MGTQLTGQCKCGYDANVYIASGRAEHGKVFNYPHHCDSCNSLTSVDLLGNNYTCYECGSDQIHSYAAPTKTLSYDSIFNRLSTELLKSAGYHRADVVHEESHCYSLRKSFVFLRGNHYCPRCKENSMRFFTSMLYD